MFYNVNPSTSFIAHVQTSFNKYIRLYKTLCGYEINPYFSSSFSFRADRAVVIEVWNNV